MRVKVQDNFIEPVKVGDRLEFRFNSGENLDRVIFDSKGFLGDLRLEDIQLEQSTIGSSFVKPLHTESPESGLFKTVQGINFELFNPESDTWLEVKRTADASISTYHNGTLQSTIGQTVEDVIFGVRDILSGDESSFNLRLDGIQQVVKDEMFESVQTQLSDFIGTELTDIEGNINTLQNTATSHAQRLSDSEGNINTLQNTTTSHTQRLSDAEGNINTVTNTVNSHVQKIENIEGDYNTLANTVDAHTRTIGSSGGNLAQMVMTDRQFQVNVIDEIEDAKSSYTQMADMIGLRASGNSIYIGGRGILIDAASIFLGSSTQIADGIITNRMISSFADIDGAKIRDLTVDSSRIINLDVSKISGNTANFVRASFNSISSSLTIDSRGMKVNAGRWNLWLDNNGIDFESNQTGDMVGNLLALVHTDTREPFSVGLVARSGYSVMLGHHVSGTTHSAGVRVQGDNGTTTLMAVQDIGFGHRTADSHQYGRLNYVSGSGDIRLRSYGSNRNVRLLSENIIYLGSQNKSNTFTLDSDGSHLYSNLNMRGYNITNQSDIRYKKNISDTSLNSLEIIRQLHFIGFNYKDIRPLGVDSEKLADGRKIGLSAQDSPYLAEYDKENDIWSINTSKQIMINSHAIQQQDLIVQQLEERVEELERMIL